MVPLRQPCLCALVFLLATCVEAGGKEDAAQKEAAMRKEVERQLALSAIVNTDMRQLSGQHNRRPALNAYREAPYVAGYDEIERQYTQGKKEYVQATAAKHAEEEHQRAYYRQHFGPGSRLVKAAAYAAAASGSADVHHSHYTDDHHHDSPSSDS